jgi:hypothetical protein
MFFIVEHEGQSHNVYVTINEHAQFQGLDPSEWPGRGILESKPFILDLVKEKADKESALFIDGPNATLEFYQLAWDGEYSHEDHRAYQHFTWKSERYITKDIMSTTDKDLFFMRSKTATQSKPGAVLTVKTTQFPPRIQKRISDALQGKPTIWDRFFKRL